MKVAAAIVLAVASLLQPAAAQDAARGMRIYVNTAELTGKPVAACVTCHANVRTLRELIRNRGGRIDDTQALARWLQAVFAGAQPGAAKVKAQYRGALTAADLRDLAAYIAESKIATTSF